MSELRYWVWLSALKGLGGATAASLLQKMGSPEKIFFASEEEYNFFGIGEREKRLLSDKSLDRAFSIIDDCRNLGIRMMSLHDAEYPGRLKNIYDPPIMLYIKGKLPAIDDEAAIAVVGTRNCTPYGVKSAERMGYELARAGCVVVTGMAKGIDAAAAYGALRGGGKVIGVAGSGPEIIYPAENRRLFEDVYQIGAVISEYPPKTQIKGSHFPPRNRIISGISTGVVVVEAPKKSGALITASKALEQGRDVFAVLANADSVAAYGSNMLIREGAIPVMSGDDVAGEYAALFPEKIVLHRRKQPLDIKAGERLVKAESFETAEKKADDKKIIDKPQSADYDLRRLLPEMTEDEKCLYDILSDGQKHIDELIEKSGLAVHKAISTLTMMEIKGIIKQDNSKNFKLIIH